jgi:hypothetical protein
MKKAYIPVAVSYRTMAGKYPSQYPSMIWKGMHLGGVSDKGHCMTEHITMIILEASERSKALLAYIYGADAGVRNMKNPLSLTVSHEFVQYAKDNTAHACDLWTEYFAPVQEFPRHIPRAKDILSLAAYDLPNWPVALLNWFVKSLGAKRVDKLMEGVLPEVANLHSRQMTL